jgi:hypothetical protein
VSMNGKRLAPLALLFLIAAVAAAPIRSVHRRPASPRAFPDTRARTLVFADQLPAQMSDAQWRFAATHYVAGSPWIAAADAPLDAGPPAR